jgi:YesN/AraC family two-component response regulator
MTTPNDSETCESSNDSSKQRDSLFSTFNVKSSSCLSIAEFISFILKPFSKKKILTILNMVSQELSLSDEPPKSNNLNKRKARKVPPVKQASYKKNERYLDLEKQRAKNNNELTELLRKFISDNEIKSQNYYDKVEASEPLPARLRSVQIIKELNSYNTNEDFKKILDKHKIVSDLIASLHKVRDQIKSENNFSQSE